MEMDETWQPQASSIAFGAFSTHTSGLLTDAPPLGLPGYVPRGVTGTHAVAIFHRFAGSCRGQRHASPERVTARARDEKL